MKTTALALVSCLACSGGPGFAAPPQIDPVFMDGMVVQRESVIVVSGTAEPRQRVTVTLGEASSTSRSGRDGRWAIDIRVPKESNPVTLTAETEDGTDSRGDVLIGDVWLCSGQSNMAWPVSRALNPSRYLNGPFDPDIRLLKVSTESALSPQSSLPERDRWEAVSVDALDEFSALCYFFALEQRKSSDVPFGLIDSSWGGSRIEPWISRNAFAAADLEADRLALLDAYVADRQTGLDRFADIWEGWWAASGARHPAPWTMADKGPWKTLEGPMRDWKAYGDRQLENHFGMVWFCNTVTLDAQEAESISRIDLGEVDEIDTLWINGRLVAFSFGWGTPRSYDLKPGLLQEGENLIVLNVLNGYGPGGLLGPAEDMKLVGEGVESALGGAWSYRKVPREVGSPPTPPWFSVNGLSGLSNAMIAPLTPYGLKGAIWYQGESNTGEPNTYAALLRTLIADWRTRFGEEFPVLVVQLPEFGSLQSEPVDSGWAGLREAQRIVAAEDPLTGLVVAMDAGTRFDIHPPNKLTIAQRAYASWKAMIDGRHHEADGYAPMSAASSSTGVQVQWPEGSGAALKLMSFGRVIGLQLCDTDGACSFAFGTLDEDRIRIETDARNEIREVRYCWADVPLCNLYHGDWTPVTPFSLTVESAGEP